MEIKITKDSTPHEKHEAWKQILEMDLDMAEFIKQVNAVFGKPDSVEVKSK